MIKKKIPVDILGEFANVANSILRTKPINIHKFISFTRNLDKTGINLEPPGDSPRNE